MKLKKDVNDFKRLNKDQLVEMIFELDKVILGLKAKNVELERMLEERGDVIQSLDSSKTFHGNIDIAINELMLNSVKLDKILEECKRQKNELERLKVEGNVSRNMNINNYSDPELSDVFDIESKGDEDLNSNE